MNLYKFHDEPHKLAHHSAAEKVADVVWDKFQDMYHDPEIPHETSLEYIKKREKVIAHSPKISFDYANEILHGPFKLGEPAIAKNPSYSYEYARFILRKPFKLAEPEIAKVPHYAFDYARFILNGRFALAEPEIAKHAGTSYMYALHVIRGRFKLGEKAILSNPINSYGYAREVIGGRWPEFEKSILERAKSGATKHNDLYAVVRYAFYVMEERWKEAEPLIEKDHGLKDWYQRRFHCKI